ncbi:type II secretion system protein [Candidatus Woesebacteria bacterium]|nr:type II secretion system protein [Candidatus Woesebacteria bacterium]
MSKEERMKLSAVHAFTIIELTLVIAVIGIMAAVGMNYFPSAQIKARDTQRMSDIKNYANALEVYYVANDGTYPSANDDLDQICTSGFQNAECPVDPQGTSYQYYAVNGGSEYFIYSELEGVGGATKYYIICSNGLVGEIESDPGTNSTCPLP